MSIDEEYHNDEELVDQYLKEGNKKALGILLQRYESRITRLAYRILHDIHEAQDIYQSVCLKVWENIAKFRWESRFSSWLYRITINETYSHLRKNWIQPRKNFGDLDEIDKNREFVLNVADQDGDFRLVAPDQLTSLISKSVIQGITDAVLSLPEISRRIIVLRFYEGKLISEIAELTKMSSSSVKMQLKRARAKLRKKLKDIKE